MLYNFVVVLAALLHLYVPTIFFDAVPQQHSVPPYPYWLLLLANVGLLCQVNFWPKRFRKLPFVVLAGTEALLALLMLKLGTALLWNYMMGAVIQVVQHLCILVTPTSKHPVCRELEHFVLNVLSFTLAMHTLDYMQLLEYCSNIQQQLKQLWRCSRLYGMGAYAFLKLDSGQRHVVLLRCQMQAERRTALSEKQLWQAKD